MATVSNDYTTSTYKSPYVTERNSTNTITNPGSKLDKDDFMKLFLTQMKYQDATAPMDSKEILSQTSQLATLEMQTNTNTALEKLSKGFNESAGLTVVSAIGKMGSLGTNSITLKSAGKGGVFEMYYPEDIKSATITIKDSTGNIVKSVPLSEQAKGVKAFEWDGTNADGAAVAAGKYTITSSYVTADGSSAKETAYGVYPIESVRFDADGAKVKLGSSYVPFEDIAEIYEFQES